MLLSFFRLLGQGRYLPLGSKHFILEFEQIFYSEKTRFYFLTATFGKKMITFYNPKGSL